jgi:hypothetical protein
MDRDDVAGARQIDGRLDRVPFAHVDRPRGGAGRRHRCDQAGGDAEGERAH